REAGRAVRTSLFVYVAHTARPAGVFAADGVGRVRPRGSFPHLMRGSRTLRPNRPDLHRGPDLGWDRPAKPRHRSATNPAPPPSRSRLWKVHWTFHFAARTGCSPPVR